MRSAPAAIALMLLLSACATAGKAPACSGARRPANPYGSVLAPNTPPSVPPTDVSATPCAGARP
jgi:hypothetical protein